MALLQAASPAIAAKPGQLLADRIEVAFRACALQLTQKDYLTAKNSKALDEVGVKLDKAPPADVLGMASRLFGTQGLYASISTTEGKMWMAASATVPACKVTVADTPLSLTARSLWADKLRGTNGWTFDKTRSGMNGNLMRDLFVLNAQRPGGHMVVMLDGPNIVWQEGKGIQMIMTVALDTAKAQ
ncbi:hypothetical protein [Sphingobium aquiterrae]|uniref:hypothetical protein n=1 Tax=Sphingobium aquiterrae TaxID=2038656 RepID=UPI0030191F2D